MKIDRYVAVEVKAFGQGMQKMFEGVAQVFSAIGAEEPERVELEKQKWKKESAKETQEEKQHETETTGPEMDDSGSPDDNADVPAADTGNEPVVQEAEEITDSPKSTDTPVSQEKPEANPAKAEKAEASSFTLDDITKIIVRKIKQNSGNNEKIGAVLKDFGVSKISELTKDQYEPFVTAIAGI